MPSLRIRTPFAVAFVALLLASAYLGLTTQKIPQYAQSDKVLHFVCFFLLTLTFYWILDTSRRRVVHLTLVVCTAGLSICSELVQAALPNGRSFDPYDILANIVGSALALALCQWYHRRMLERRRKAKNYDLVPGEDTMDDLELGDGPGLTTDDNEATPVDANGTKAAPATSKGVDVTDELDRWDENGADWEEDESGAAAPHTDGNVEDDAKKRAD